MDIYKTFKDFNVNSNFQNHNFINKNSFPNQFIWVYDILQLIPLKEQVLRENFVYELPEKLIRIIFELFKTQENDFFNWLTESETTEDEKYYSSIIHSLFEEEYIKYTYVEKTEEDLEYFRSEAEKIIKGNEFLLKRYKEQEQIVNIPKELFFIKPFLLLIKTSETIEAVEKKLPVNIIDLADKSLRRGSQIIDKYLEEEGIVKTEIVERIKVLKEVGDRYIDKLFQF